MLPVSQHDDLGLGIGLSDLESIHWLGQQQMKKSVGNAFWKYYGVYNIYLYN